jgi:hypothetical protein
MDFEYLHEVEDVLLTSNTKRSCAVLWTLFREQGFTLYEDVFSLDRPKKPKLPLWQSEAFVDVDIFNDETPIYEPEKEWNRIVLKYLLATQPRFGIAVFSKNAAEISARLSIPMIFRGKLVIRDELEKHLNIIADELTAQLGEPGSEDVAIVIQSTYPRRRT